MGLSTKLVVGGAVAGTALAYYVRNRRARTGDGYLDIVRSLPGDVVRWVHETRSRAGLALTDGKAAARERDAEFAQRLLDAGAPPGA
jgi:hypothetical protein